MDTSDDGMNPPLNDSTADLTGKIMVVAIIVLFLVVVFVLFLHLYAKWFWWRIEDPTVPSRESRNPRRRRLIFGQDPAAAAALRTGLDPVVLRSLPVLIFHSEDFKEGLECAVCLSELSQGEKARLLPKCNHGFHLECIDMWFQSHSTCPLCRNPVVLSSGCGDGVAAGAEDLGENSVIGESLNFPTNVLFWGNQTQVSSRGACLEEGHSSQSTATTTTPLPASTNLRPEGMLVIDIPENHLSAALPSPAMRVVAEEEMKSPMTTRLRSLKRLLSKEKRVVCPCSSSCVEAEQ